MIRNAQHMWNTGDERMAFSVMASYTGLPCQVAFDLVTGSQEYTVEGDDVIVEVETPDQSQSEVDRMAEENVWGEHPEYPRGDWRYEVGQRDTNRGYWDWVRHQLEMVEDEVYCDESPDDLTIATPRPPVGEGEEISAADNS